MTCRRAGRIECAHVMMMKKEKLMKKQSSQTSQAKAQQCPCPFRHRLVEPRDALRGIKADPCGSGGGGYEATTGRILPPRSHQRACLTHTCGSRGPHVLGLQSVGVPTLRVLPLPRPLPPRHGAPGLLVACARGLSVQDACPKRSNWTESRRAAMAGAPMI